MFCLREIALFTQIHRIGQKSTERTVDQSLDCIHNILLERLRLCEYLLVWKAFSFKSNSSDGHRLFLSEPLLWIFIIMIIQLS